jgi:ubiquinone/menaquinone biosynthesis C-methylase UbiE
MAVTCERNSNEDPLGPASSKVFEDPKLFQKWDQDYYEPAARPFYDRTVKRMLGQLRCPTSQPVLDAGCGPGEHSIRAAREGFRVVALDISETVIGEARSRAAAAGVEDRITFQQGNLTRLEFADASFSAIFCWGVLTHIREAETALQELVRILKPGGRLALYVTNAGACDHLLLKWARKLLGKPAVRYESLPMGRGIWHELGEDRLWVWHFDIEALSDFLKASGMRQVTRQAGQLTELHRRTSGKLRTGLVWLCRAYSYLPLPARPCADNLLIFEKRQ